MTAAKHETSLKLIAIGNSVGMILPRDVLSRMHLAEGDKVVLTESPDGYRINPYDAQFEHHMEAASEIMKRRRAALRELAK